MRMVRRRRRRAVCLPKHGGRVERQVGVGGRRVLCVLRLVGTRLAVLRIVGGRRCVVLGPCIVLLLRGVHRVAVAVGHAGAARRVAVLGRRMVLPLRQIGMQGGHGFLCRAHHRCRRRPTGRCRGFGAGGGRGRAGGVIEVSRSNGGVLAALAAARRHRLAGRQRGSQQVVRVLVRRGGGGVAAGGRGARRRLLGCQCRLLLLQPPLLLVSERREHLRKHGGHVCRAVCRRRPSRGGRRRRGRRGRGRRCRGGRGRCRGGSRALLLLRGGHRGDGRLLGGVEGGAVGCLLLRCGE